MSNEALEGSIISVDKDSTDGSFTVEERFMKPTPEYPDGSYLRTVAGKVEIATGFYALEHPDKPSPYWHGKPPVVFIDWGR